MNDAPLGFPPGHFYSPIPSLSSVFRREAEIFAVPEELPGIDLDVRNQLALLRTLGELCAGQPFVAEGTSDTRFQSPNETFSAGEACIYFGMLRHLRPRRVIEIGSGCTTLALLDTLDRSDMNKYRMYLHEPYPAFLLSMLSKQDQQRLRLIEKELQDVPVDTFRSLQAGDLLFVDSTHVSKTGSDVNAIIFHILPLLAPGVYVHFHDIYYPFEYPKEWVRQGRAWNEAYILRAFLQFNPVFRICFFNSWIAIFHRGAMAQGLYAFALQPGSSLWLRKER